jgi:hypothetical protein
MHVSRLVPLACVAVLLAAATLSGAADDGQVSSRRGLEGSAAVRQEETPPARVEPFSRTTIGVEFAGAVLTEAWSANETHEWLAVGNAGIWWAFLDHVTFVLELQATRVFQSPSRNAFVQGLTPVFRWRVHDAYPWAVFVELGPGVSWSDTPVPVRGTRFNYLLVAGGGVTRRLSGRSQVLAGLRWLHLSNAGRAGRGRNPDIQSLGPYAGFGLSF